MEVMASQYLGLESTESWMLTGQQSDIVRRPSYTPKGTKPKVRKKPIGIVVLKTKPDKK